MTNLQPVDLSIHVGSYGCRVIVGIEILLLSKILFLSFCLGPGNPWLIQLYSDHVPHPFASIVGQEVFQSGLIPSDTDYRIFRDYGGLPGLYSCPVFSNVCCRHLIAKDGGLQSK